MDEILDEIRAFDGVVEVAPREGDGAPQIAWGDHFFYYSPDGTVPQHTQPYATIVTKDYPDDTRSNLDAEGRWRLNIHVGSAKARQLVRDSASGVDASGDSASGIDASDVGSSGVDFSEVDTILPHPVYGHLGWIAIVNPGQRVGAAVLELLHDAHEDERRRVERRA
ncbi:DUF6194 family protein [Arthrobacter ruber]|uniref:DUF6194 family protein n=1 Tax=Arthrobacter ruber TaxID=1258893 RepID=UPI001F0BBD40|nr:DUF6194 family protein [Arthrobacter ruber]